MVIEEWLTLKVSVLLSLRKCHEFLGPEDKQRWADMVYSFIEHRQLLVSYSAHISGFLTDHALCSVKAILPFIPKDKPKLDKVIYEHVLNEFLLSDPNVKTLLYCTSIGVYLFSPTDVV